jgi:hypothetical protein
LGVHWYRERHFSNIIQSDTIKAFPQERSSAVLTVTDFRKVPLGTVTFLGIVEVCPYCKQAGLHERAYGRDYFVHILIVGTNNRGDPDIKWEMCPKERKEVPS